MKASYFRSLEQDLRGFLKRRLQEKSPPRYVTDDICRRITDSEEYWPRRTVMSRLVPSGFHSYKPTPTNRDLEQAIREVEQVAAVCEEEEATSRSEDSSEYGGESKPMESPPSWKTRSVEGAPLRGWGEICKALKVESTRAKQKALKKANEDTDGPIGWVRGRPEAHRKRLLAWSDDIVGRGQEAARQRESTQAVLTERGGRKLADFGMQKEARPNARGKAK